MKKQFAFVILICLCWLSSIMTALAHSPNEIHYALAIEPSQNTLTIHITPQGAVRLFKHEGWMPESENVVDFTQFRTQMKSYFLEKVALKVGETPIALKMQDMDLQQHDASVVFTFELPASQKVDLNIFSTAFEGVFTNLRNAASITLDGTTYNGKWNVEQNKASFELTAANIKQDYSIYWWLLLFLPAVVLIYFWRRRRI